MNIAFVWEWERAREIEPNWRDGLRAALEILGKKHNVDWYLMKAPELNKKYDWIITWCDSNSNFSSYFTKYPAKRAIFLTTHPTNYHNLLGFDVVFCETSVIYEECRMRGIHAKRAFGTDDKFFTPIKSQKDIEYFYPATFSPWKKQSDICHLGNRLVCIGTIQPDGQGEYDSCVNNAVITKVGYFPPEVIRDYYRRSKEVIIPAVHGSERTVLESMSCNILPEVTNPDNKRARSYIEEFIKSGLAHPREFINKFYSAKKYAKDIEEGLNAC
jgi:hypothetical protein